MKRYLAFRGEYHYATGGMYDFLGDFDTLEEAINLVRGGTDKFEVDWWLEGNDWGHVWDSDTREKLSVDNHPICGHY